jgi:hypothetical protein
MAIVPPNNNYGQFNTGPQAPVVWDEVQPTNNELINRNEMPFTSTVEYTGYYKAQSTGSHTFTLDGSDSITGYAWVSSAPRSSDHITVVDDIRAETVFNRSFGIRIPAKVGNYWPFEDRNVLGTNFPGYGYWPASLTGSPQYGNSSGWTGYFDGTSTPLSVCGYGTSNPLRTTHQYFLPGDIRTYGSNYYSNFAKTAGPAWQGSEDPNFEAPCYTNGSRSLPLYKLPNTTDSVDKTDAGTTHQTVGKISQVFLDENFKAEGTSTDNWATYRTVDVSNAGDHVYIWPQKVSIAGTGVKDPERVMIRFGIRLYGPEQEYTFEWRCREGLKMWYLTGSGDIRNMIKFPDDEEGNNPCNLSSSNTGTTGWRPGGGMRGWTGKLTCRNNAFVQFAGYGVGVPTEDTHGWSLVIKDAAGEIVWTTEKLLTGVEDTLVGIDECGYHAYLDRADRVTANKQSEFYKANGWKGYINGPGGEDLFLADYEVGDTLERDVNTTRQYLWSNAISKCRGGTSIPGSVYLRQGDYYYMRVIASNHEDKSANFRYNVRSPNGGTSDVRFSGNGDPNSDSTVGGSAGGNGIAINTSVLCDPNGPFYQGGAVAQQDTNFAMVDSLSAVINLNALGVSDFQIGREGQAESVTLPGGGGGGGAPASLNLDFTAPDDSTVRVKLEVLVRGGTNNIPAMTSEQRAAVLNTYQIQITPDSSGVTASVPYNTFRSAITSKAVISWGSNLVGNQGAGNYPYIYHTVAEVITSICTGTPIEPPVLRNSLANTNAQENYSSSSSGGDTCFDVDFSSLSSGQAQITTECFDECKAPDDYPILTSQYNKKNQADYANMDSRYYAMILVRPGWGNENRFVTLDSVSSAGNKVAKAIARNAPIALKPGVISCQPLTVPDIFLPDDLSGTKVPLDMEVIVELSSNTFRKDVNNVNVEIGVDRPYIVCWYSVIPGGPSLGRYHFSQMPNGQTYRHRATFSKEIYDRANLNYTAYLGNTYGVRYVNFVTLKKADVQAVNFDVPEPGSTAFVNMMSEIGYTSNEIRTFTTVPSPNCNSLSTQSNNSSQDNTFASKSNMTPYTGESWDGNVPNHVNIATNGGFTWASQPGGNMTAYPAGIGPGNNSPRLTGNAIWFPQPLNGKILSYEWLATNDKICVGAQYTWVTSPAGGNAVLRNCSPKLTCVRWFSATPGGDPLKDQNGNQRIFDVEDGQADPTFSIAQLYDYADANNTNYIIPVITKKYWLNAAIIERSLLATLQSAGRAPTASEVQVFDPKSCGSDYDYMYIVSAPNGQVYNFDDWKKDNL